MHARGMVPRASLKHWQASRFRSARKRLIECGNVVRAQREITGGGVVSGVFRVRGFRNRKHMRIAREKGQRDLTRRGAQALGDGLQYGAAGAARLGKLVVAERRI